MSLYTHTLRVLPIHFGRETVPSGLPPYRKHETTDCDDIKGGLRSIFWGGGGGVLFVDEKLFIITPLGYLCIYSNTYSRNKFMI